VDVLHRTWEELEYSLDVLRAAKGAHIEVYWSQKNLREFTMICRNRTICLRATIFQNPEGTCGHTYENFVSSDSSDSKWHVAR
jgi:hypothetical protein